MAKPYSYPVDNRRIFTIMAGLTGWYETQLNVYEIVGAGVHSKVKSFEAYYSGEETPRYQIRYFHGANTVFITNLKTMASLEYKLLD